MWRPSPPDDESSEQSSKGSWASLVQYVIATGRWFGWGRIITITICVPLVGIGGFLLVRAPPAPPESSLTLATVTPLSTLAIEVSSTSTTLLATQIMVHVAGNVKFPGVYMLPNGSRVINAILAAGGATALGDLNNVNLAKLIVDQEQIYIPLVGEKPAGSEVGVPHSSGIPEQGATSSTNVAFPININTADLAMLDILPGIGPATALAIIRYREEHGQFASVQGLLDVPGIGPAKVQALHGLVTV